MRPSMLPQAFGLGVLMVSAVTAVPMESENVHARMPDATALQTQSYLVRPTSRSSSPTSSFPPPPPPAHTSVDSAATRPATDSRKPPPSSVTVARSAMTPYYYGCNKTEKAIAQKAWDEAGQLADAHAKWKPPGWWKSGDFQPAMDIYLGTDSRDDDPWFGTGPLKQNINRQQGIHTDNPSWSPYWSYAYIYCDEGKVPNKPKKPEADECNRPRDKDKKVAAYTFPDDGHWYSWNAKYVVLCPRFFDTDILTLEEQTKNAKDDKNLQAWMKPWRKVRARVMFHETYHWGPAEVSDPRCNRNPEIRGSLEVAKLAKDENTKGARINAESWAQAAMAIYVQDTFKLKNPPQPGGPDAVNITDDIEENFFDSAPDWFQSPVDLNADKYEPPHDDD